MARELGPLGIHVAHVVVDGVVDNPNTRSVFPGAFEARPDDGVVRPQDLAGIFWDIHTQDRSAWTFEVDARPYSETW